MGRVILTVALFLLAGPGLACVLRAPFDPARIDGAQIVVVGKVTGYQELETLPASALVTVAVEISLKGQASGMVTFVWNSGLAQGPHPGAAKGRVLIGAMRGGRIAVSDRVPDARPDLPSIIQPYCGEMWMQPATARLLRKVREALE